MNVEKLTRENIEIESLNSNTSLIGSNPEEIAWKIFGISQNPNYQKTVQETVNTNRDNPSNLVVSIIQRGLPWQQNHLNFH